MVSVSLSENMKNSAAGAAAADADWAVVGAAAMAAGAAAVDFLIDMFCEFWAT